MSPQVEEYCRCLSLYCRLGERTFRRASAAIGRCLGRGAPGQEPLNAVLAGALERKLSRLRSAFPQVAVPADLRARSGAGSTLVQLRRAHRLFWGAVSDLADDNELDVCRAGREGRRRTTSAWIEGEILEDATLAGRIAARGAP